MAEAGSKLPEARWRARSLWLDLLPGPLTPRPALPGDTSCDVAIVGAGFTGLWTAYFLKTLRPDLRVVVVEREIAGFGAAGRNGGHVSGGVSGDSQVYARRSGWDAVRRAERTTYAAVAEIGRIAVDEGIDCGFAQGGSLAVACEPAQVERLEQFVEGMRPRGAGEQDVHPLTAEQVFERVRILGVRAGAYIPHCARVDPARLARGLADAVERRGVVIHEQTPALAVEPRRVVCPSGTISAEMVVRATEAFTIELPGERRRFLPLYSLMVATEPLPAEAWSQIGMTGCETMWDMRHLFFYLQRTSDGRIAIGGRGGCYALGSPIRHREEQRDDVRARLTAAIARHFPAAAGAAISHHWGGALAVPRDWSMAVHCDRSAGFAWAGGYSGHGVVAAHIAGRTLADLILDRATDLTTLPWVGHTSGRWEPEPLRFLASRAIVAVMGSADRVESRGSRRTARRMRMIEPFIAGRHR